MKDRLTPEEVRARMEAMDAHRAEIERRTDPIIAKAKAYHAGKATRADVVRAVVEAGFPAGVADIYIHESRPDDIATNPNDT